MKVFLVLLSAIGALLLVGCSSVSVTTDYDHQADFAALKTYDWMSTTEDAVTANAQAAMFQTSLVQNKLRRAVSAQLEQKGVKQDSSKPDFLIAYHFGTQQKVSINSYGYGYGGWYGGTDVQQYTQGTIILDFVSATTKELVWRGVATGALADRPDPAQAEAKINDVVAQMLHDYPPAAKK
jgi:hypothetical protein